MAIMRSTRLGWLNVYFAEFAALADPDLVGAKVSAMNVTGLGGYRCWTLAAQRRCGAPGVPCRST